jgi:REP element-mobilizing transposase RayT
MRRFTPRRHPQHFANSLGYVFLTWRLHRKQPALRPGERDAVLAIVGRLDGPGNHLRAAVVMDDHVHALFYLGAPRPIRVIAHTWKSLSAHRLTKEWHRTAPIWQRDYFDRAVRSIAGVERCTRYILDNPIRRWPDVTNYRWIIRRSAEEGRATGPA